MKLKIYFILVFLFLTKFSEAQVKSCKNFDWTKTFGSAWNDNINSIKNDNKGNTFLAGSYFFYAKINDSVYNSIGGTDITIAKMDSLGNYVWVTNIGSDANDESIDIAIDSDENCYVAGYVGDEKVYCGNKKITFPWGYTNFIAKLDKNGKSIWAVSANASSKFTTSSIAVDSKGICIVTGSFTGTATFGNIKITSSNSGKNSNIYIAKLDKNGNYIWVTSAEATTSIIATDNNQNSYITGSFIKTSQFGNINLTDSTSSAAYIAKLDSNGKFVWASKTNSFSRVSIRAMAVNKDGECFISGNFNGKVLLDTFIITSKGESNVYTAKLDSKGKFLWAVSADGTGAADILSMAIDESGNSYISGFISNVNKFGNTTLSSLQGTIDYFVSKLDKNGNYIWARKIDNEKKYVNTDDRKTLLISVSTDENVTIAGTFTGSKKFRDITLISKGKKDIYISKLKDFTLKLTPINDSSLTCGKTIQLTANAAYFESAKWTPIIDISDSTILNPIFSNIKTTTYELKVLDGCDQSISEKVTITVNPYSIDLGEDKNIFCGQYYQLNTQISEPIPNIIYNWNNTVDLNIKNIYNPIANPIENKIFKVTATTAKGCTSSDSIEIFVKPYTVDIGQDLSINCGNYTQLNAELNDTVPNINYSWTPTTGLNNSKIENPIIKPIETTQYKVTASTSKGCFASDSVNITLNNPYPPTVTIISNTGSFYLCDGGIQLSVFGFDSNIWSNGSTDVFIIVSKPGWYSVISIDEDGCAGTDSVEIKTYAEISAPLGTILCSDKPNQKIKLIATAGMDSYEWNTGEQTQSIEVATSGIYSVMVDKNNCTFTSKIEVSKSNGQALADFSYLANELVVNFNDLSPSTSNVIWDFGDGKTSIENNPKHIYDKSGNYDVKLSITDYCGYKAEKIKSINVSGQTSNLSKIAETSVLVYPNPANENITFDISKMGNSDHLLIFDLNGKQIINQNLNTSKTTINISHWNEGIYLYKIIGNEQIHSGKFVILNK